MSECSFTEFVTEKSWISTSRTTSSAGTIRCARRYGEAKILEIDEGTTDMHPLADVRDPGYSVW